MAYVKIAARLRPKLPGEVDDDGLQIVRSEDGGAQISVPNPRDVSQVFKFPFASCYDASATQEEIYERDVKPTIDIVYTGVTVTIFAYGVTSSGKTHTMQGTREQPGVIPRAVAGLFAKRETLPPQEAESISLAVSYIEIYKDEVFDLLVNRADAPKLPVRENDAGQVFVANLTRLPIDSVAEFDTIYSRANKQRSVGATNLNRASSRSHAVLTIEVTMSDEMQGKTRMGKINLVDLAGSENNKLTGNDPSRMAESAAINKSLSVLGQVVHALNQGATRIPYRNSKLTRLLQDALGGKSVGLLICNLAPGIKFRQDTLNTLNFAVRTKNVENKPVVHERSIAPPPKPHFAAVQRAPPKLAAANLPTASAPPTGPLPPPPSGTSPNLSLNSQVFPVAGPSRVPSAGTVPTLASTSDSVGALQPKAKGRARPSRVPRMSMAGAAAFGLGLGGAAASLLHGHGSNVPALKPLNETDMDERIRKMVEQEVERRLEGVRAREEALERAEREVAERAERENSRSVDERDILPPGTLTPLLQKHRELDGELMQRLEELEKKLERDNRETSLAEVMSPVSRKKTGRAYVALARAHTEKGDLQVALDFYRKAELYVPENAKLKERILDVEYCIKNGVAFRSGSPKTASKEVKKKGKKKSTDSKKKTRTRSAHKSAADTSVGDSNTANSSGAVQEDDEETDILVVPKEEDTLAATADTSVLLTAPSVKAEDNLMQVELPPVDHGADHLSHVVFGTDTTNQQTSLGSPTTSTGTKRGHHEAVLDHGFEEEDDREEKEQKRRRRSAAERRAVKVQVEESDEEESDVPVPRRSARVANTTTA